MTILKKKFSTQITDNERKIHKKPKKKKDNVTKYQRDEI